MRPQPHGVGPHSIQALDDRTLHDRFSDIRGTNTDASGAPRGEAMCPFTSAVNGHPMSIQFAHRMSPRLDGGVRRQTSSSGRWIWSVAVGRVWWTWLAYLRGLTQANEVSKPAWKPSGTLLDRRVRRVRTVLAGQRWLLVAVARMSLRSAFGPCYGSHLDRTSLPVRPGVGPAHRPPGCWQRRR